MGRPRRIPRGNDRAASMNHTRQSLVHAGLGLAAGFPSIAFAGPPRPTATQIESPWCAARTATCMAFLMTSADATTGSLPRRARGRRAHHRVRVRRFANPLPCRLDPRPGRLALRQGHLLLRRDRRGRQEQRRWRSLTYARRWPRVLSALALKTGCGLSTAAT